MPYVVVRGRTLALLISTSLVLALIPLAPALFLYVMPLARKEHVRDVKTAVLTDGIYMPWSRTMYTLIALTVLGGLTPVTIVEYFNGRYVEAIERELANFFKGLAEGVRAGVPMIKALEMTARATGGPLRREILSVVTSVEMGSSLKEALDRLVRRVNVPSLKRAATLILVAYESGGRVAEVLDAAAEMYGMIRSYEDEKKASIAPHAWTVYMSLIIFLLISTVILVGFVEQLHKLGGVSILASPIPPSLFKAIFFISSYMEALLGGLVVGKMRKGTVRAGLLHSLILSGIVIIYFNLLELYIEGFLGKIFLSRPG